MIRQGASPGSDDIMTGLYQTIFTSPTTPQYMGPILYQIINIY
jgi:hypothetical protein